MEWTRGPILGRGSSATVSTATSTSGDIFAVKSVDFLHSEILQKEQLFLSILKSPYVVSYKGCDITKEENKLIYNIFIDYMAGGSVIDLLNHRNGVGFTNLEISRYTRQILRGLEYIHSCGVVHCDIKGRNLLVDGDNCVKVGDFGCAKWIDDVAAPICGTPMFMAPEVTRGEEQGFPADIWALGCTMIEMLTGDSPWSNVGDPVSVLYRIAFSGEIPEIPDGFSDQAKDFIGKCLIRDPRQRWTVKQLLKHPYIQQFDDNLGLIMCEKIGTNSPTSVLDQDVWDSIEESSSSISSSSSSSVVASSLRHKIKQLAGKSEMPNWGCEKGGNGWLTIRIIDRKVNSGAVTCVVGDEMAVVGVHHEWR